MSQHTPGPWTLDTSLHIYGQLPPVPIAGGGTMSELPHVGSANRYADARLMTAAPQLLAMLELLYQHLDRAVIYSDILLTEPGVKISLQQAREALCAASAEWEKATRKRKA